VSVAVRKLDGVESVKLSLEEGSADIKLKPGNTISLGQLRRLIRDNGFTPRDAEVTARGKLAERGGGPAIEVTVIEVVYRLQEHEDAPGTLATLEEAASLGALIEVSGTVRECPNEAPELYLRAFKVEEGNSGGGDSGKALTVKGRLTDEGVECPAMRGDDGKLYTLLGDLKGHRPGDTVCVRGRVAEISFCMQGTTLAVEQIGRTCP